MTATCRPGRDWILLAAAVAGLAALAGCTPRDPAPVQLCKFAVARALSGEGTLAHVYVSRTPLAHGERVDLEFAAQPPDDRPWSGAAECRVRQSRYSVRLAALRLDGRPVPEATLAAINADWHSAEDASKLYQL